MLKKSLWAVLLSVVFALVLGTSGAFAAEATASEVAEKALQEVEKSNNKIHEEIEKAQQKSHELHAKYQQDIAAETDKEKQAVISAKYEEKVTDLISKLDVKTQNITRKGVEKAEKAGLKVEIYWIPVQFADRTAMIDPIKVMDW